MLWGIISTTFLGIQYYKEKSEPHIPAENWRNRKLYNKDQLDPKVSPQQLMNNVRNGKYWMSDKDYEAYQKAEEPKYTLQKPIIEIEGDYILICSLSLSQYAQECSYKRACRSLEKHGKVELARATPCSSHIIDEKIGDVYNSILQKIKNHYNGKINVRHKGNYGHIVIETRGDNNDCQWTDVFL